MPSVVLLLLDGPVLVDCHQVIEIGLKFLFNLSNPDFITSIFQVILYWFANDEIEHVNDEE